MSRRARRSSLGTSRRRTPRNGCPRCCDGAVMAGHAEGRGAGMILCANPGAQYRAHKAEIDAAIARVLERGWYILGDEVRAFEAEFAGYVGAAHGVGVGSGTEALHLALAACGIGPGDEVVTVSHTAVATVAAVAMAGATPV